MIITWTEKINSDIDYYIRKKKYKKQRGLLRLSKRKTMKRQISKLFTTHTLRMLFLSAYLTHKKSTKTNILSSELTITGQVWVLIMLIRNSVKL